MGKPFKCAVLAHPDFSKPFILSVDASLDGFGAVLLQLPTGEDKASPIAFACKALSRSQQRYPAYHLEFVALKWSVTKKFSHWLKGRDLTVWTVNNLPTHILAKPKLDASEQRWVAKLLSYNFDLKYRIFQVQKTLRQVRSAVIPLPLLSVDVSFRSLTACCRKPKVWNLTKCRISLNWESTFFKWSSIESAPDAAGSCS